jgi:hypothetical protein
MSLYVVIQNLRSRDVYKKWIKDFGYKPSINELKRWVDSYAGFCPKYNGDNRVIGWELVKEI